ncbi:unnamed protein product [Adineta ricciae]|uniref:Uncharacterized protein n=1 Tax=Adineta ricciae TaxID=249248 RepID=A0A815PXT0_ADIRI|nr:unnamed protein product [Adineta ricciae]CAF1455134.1 unnamed protein product [Adineta ricciae]
MKKQDRKRKRLARLKMPPAKLKIFRLRQKLNLHHFRSKSKLAPTRPSPTESSFRTKQSKAKAFKRVINALPVDKDKQFELITEIAANLNIIKLEKKIERKQQALSPIVKQQVYDFYFRDDITQVNKSDAGSDRILPDPTGSYRIRPSDKIRSDSWKRNCIGIRLEKSRRLLQIL